MEHNIKSDQSPDLSDSSELEKINPSDPEKDPKGIKTYKYYPHKDSYIRQNYLTHEAFYEYFKAINIGKISSDNIKSVLYSLMATQILKKTQYTDVRIIDEIMSIKEKNRDYIRDCSNNYVTGKSDILSDKNMEKIRPIVEKYPTEIRFSDRKEMTAPTKDYFERLKPTLAGLFSENTYNVLVDLLDRGKLILAGGFISGLVFGTPSNDVDLFLTKKTKIDDIKMLLETMITKESIIYTDGACIKVWTEKSQVDIVLVRYENTHQLIESFDLSCSMFAYCKGKIYYNTYSMYTVCTGGILANNVRFLNRSPIRLVKYLKRGFSFHIPLDTERLLGMKNIKMFYIDWIDPQYVDKENGKMYIWYKCIKYNISESVNQTDINNHVDKTKFAEQYQLPIFHFGSKLGKYNPRKYDKDKVYVCVSTPVLVTKSKPTDVYFGYMQPNKFIDKLNGIYNPLTGANISKESLSLSDYLANI